MKRNMSLVRSLLLQLEGHIMEEGKIVALYTDRTDMAIEGYTSNQIGYHFGLLVDAGFIENGDTKSSSPGSNPLYFRGLTWAGHDYLDAVRDPEIWKKTKAGTDAVGSFTVDLMKELPKGFIKTKIKEHTGIEV